MVIFIKSNGTEEKYFRVRKGVHNEQYIKEKDEAKKIRLLFTINIMASNVLNNVVSEIVRYEGSDKTEYVNYKKGGIAIKTDYNKYTNRGDGSGSIGLNRTSLISDTAYSLPEIFTNNDEFIYHCGFDIFNNHLLRSKEFSILNKITTDTPSETRKYFNTLRDYNRDYFGKIVRITKETNEINEHKYTLDNISSFNESINNNLIENNGWIGFKNKAIIKVPNIVIGNKKYIINKCINNKKEEEFIDLYPDRSLFSILPKFNEYRKRLEYNWDFCLTYPYKNDFDNDLIKGGIKCNVYSTSNGNVVFRTFIKNGFTANTKIKLFFDNKNIETVINSVGIKINGVEYNDYYFTVSYDSISSVFKQFAEIRVCKLLNGIECQYYIRKFRKLPNFNKIFINQNEGLTEEDIKNGISNKFDVLYNKLGFAKNIFGDNIGQIIFNDDISVNEISDNLGRPITEIYLTIIKTNKGHKEWYENNEKRSQVIEFSHCFGRISSGFDLPFFSDDYNIHKIHNIDSTKIESASGNKMDVLNYVNKSVNPVTSDINSDNEIFDGDIVEFSIEDFSERILEDIYFRFNTAQREVISDEFSTFKIDEIIYDDYETSNYKNFKVVTVDYGAKINEESKTDDSGLINVNINPEGYFYKPHFKIKLYEFEDEVKHGAHKLVKKVVLNNARFSNNTINNDLFQDERMVNLNAFELSKEPNEYVNPLIKIDNIHNQYVVSSEYEIEYEIEELVFEVDRDNYLSIGDRLYVLDPITKSRYEDAFITNINNKIITLHFNEKIGFVSRTLYIFKPNILKPKYAYELFNAKGEYIWRDIKSFWKIDTNNELFNTIFTNNALYYEKNFNLFLKRQDPFGEYQLMKYDKLPEEISSLIISGTYKDVEKYEYFNDNYTSC